MASDLHLAQQARDLLRPAQDAQKKFEGVERVEVDRILAAMVRAGEREAHEETGFGQPKNKEERN